MALFKEVLCAECGKKAGALLRTKLQDGNYLCFDCASKVPAFLMKNCQSMDEYHGKIAYLEENSKIAEIFEENHVFSGIHLDTTHHYFYVNALSQSPKVYLNFADVEQFDLAFIAKEYKDGVISGKKVEGKITMSLRVSSPEFFFEDVIDSKAKAPAKKGFLSNKVVYDSPVGMDEFMYYFEEAVAVAKAQRAEDEGYQSSKASPNDLSLLQQAMVLYMLDTLDGVTKDQLKAQRNRLIKTFHPDNGDPADTTRYAAKINEAYDVLCDAIG